MSDVLVGLFRCVQSLQHISHRANIESLITELLTTPCVTKGVLSPSFGRHARRDLITGEAFEHFILYGAEARFPSQ